MLKMMPECARWVRKCSPRLPRQCTKSRNDRGGPGHFGRPRCAPCACPMPSRFGRDVRLDIVHDSRAVSVHNPTLVNCDVGESVRTWQVSEDEFAILRKGSRGPGHGPLAKCTRRSRELSKQTLGARLPAIEEGLVVMKMSQENGATPGLATPHSRERQRMAGASFTCMSWTLDQALAFMHNRSAP